MPTSKFTRPVLMAQISDHSVCQRPPWCQPLCEHALVLKPHTGADAAPPPAALPPQALGGQHAPGGPHVL